MLSRYIYTLWFTVQCFVFCCSPVQGQQPPSSKKGVNGPAEVKGLSDDERRALTIADTTPEAGIHFLPGGSAFVVMGKTEGAVHLFKCDDLTRPISLTSSMKGPFTSMAAARQHPLVACTGSDGYCRFIDCDTRREWRVKVKERLAPSVALTPDGSLCASSWAEILHVFPTKREDKPEGLIKPKITEVKFPGRRVMITALCFSPTGKQLVVGLSDGSFSVLSTTSIKVIQTRQAYKKRIECATFSPDGEMLLLGGSDRTIAIWNTKTWKRERELVAHEKTVSSVTFSPSGKLFASGSTDGTIWIWETATRKVKKTIRPRSGAPMSLAFHPKEPILASVSLQIQFWNTETGAETRPPRAAAGKGPKQDK